MNVRYEYLLLVIGLLALSGVGYAQSLPKDYTFSWCQYDFSFGEFGCPFCYATGDTCWQHLRVPCGRLLRCRCPDLQRLRGQDQRAAGRHRPSAQLRYPLVGFVKDAIVAGMIDYASFDSETKIAFDCVLKMCGRINDAGSCLEISTLGIGWRIV